MGEIEGVCVVPLKLIRNERGRLVEIQRHDDSHFLGFGQAYIPDEERIAPDDTRVPHRWS